MMVTYGAFGSVSIAALFMGGIVPGVLVGLTIMIVTYIWAKKHKCVAVQKRATLREVWDATKRAFTALLVPLIIILGVLSGIFTATESGMIAVVYSLFLVMFVYRTCTWKEMAEVFIKSCVESAKPLLCVGGAGAFGYMMAYLQIPQMMLDAAGPLSASKFQPCCSLRSCTSSSAPSWIRSRQSSSSFPSCSRWALPPESIPSTWACWSPWFCASVC